MLNIPEVIKELFKQDGIRKNFRVHFPNGERADLVNKDIIEESVKFTESLCSQQALKFGLTEASVIDFECVGVENIAGMTIQCGIEIDVSSLSREDRQTYGTRTEDVPFPFYAVPYGVFIVEKCPRQADMKRRRVTGYTRPGIGKVSLGAAQRSKTLAIDADAILAAGWIPEIRGMRRDDDASYIRCGYTSANDPMLLSFNPGTHDVPQNYVGRENISNTDGKVAIRVDVAGGWSSEVSDKVQARMNSRLPSGYYTDTDYRVCSSSAQSVWVMGGGLRATAVLLTYTTGARTYSMPVILEEGAINVIDLKTMRESPAYGSVIPAEQVTSQVLFVKAAGFIGPYLHVLNAGATVVVDISDLVPETITREVSISYTELPHTNGADAVFTADGKVSLPGLGDYFEFLEDLSTDELIDAVLETRGSFGSVERVGRTREITLSNDSPEEITPESIASLWFEEYTLEPPGSVLYPYLDGSEELIGEIVFREGGGYDMTNNKLLKEEAVRTQDAVREQILASFPENTAKARYTPIDLTIKARPWLEDGDAIQVTTPEGEVIDSYILRHTISGVQHLEDNIEAEGVGE